MPTYSYKCTSCDYTNSGKLFNSFKEFQEFKCPKCGAKVSQTYSNLAFKIKGYCYENETKGESMYRDIGKEKRRTYK